MTIKIVPEWLKKAIATAREEPFIASTGIAAFVHSTWALTVMFSGAPPTITDGASALQWMLYVIPAALIAFSVDVGQIVTSSQIRRGKRNIATYATFGVLALATFYLQWLYMVHHVPLLDLGAGVRNEWAAGMTIFRDLSVYIIPALLPAATMLYTASRETERKRKETERPRQKAEPGKAARGLAGLNPVNMVRNQRNANPAPPSTNGHKNKTTERN